MSILRRNLFDDNVVTRVMETSISMGSTQQTPRINGKDAVCQVSKVKKSVVTRPTRCNPVLNNEYLMRRKLKPQRAQKNSTAKHAMAPLSWYDKLQGL